MTPAERSALKHAADWIAYQRSAQASLDAAADRKRRAARDRANGHVPECSLTRCADDCAKGYGRQEMQP